MASLASRNLFLLSLCCARRGCRRSSTCWEKFLTLVCSAGQKKQITGSGAARCNHISCHCCHRATGVEDSSFAGAGDVQVRPESHRARRSGGICGCRDDRPKSDPFVAEMHLICSSTCSHVQAMWGETCSPRAPAQTFCFLLPRFLQDHQSEQAALRLTNEAKNCPNLSMEELMNQMNQEQEVPCYQIYLGGEPHHITVLSPRWKKNGILS